VLSCTESTAKSAEAEELFGEFKVPKAQEEQRFHTHGEAQGRGVHRGKGGNRQRLRPLRTGNSSKCRKKVQEAKEGAQ
jgi:hypothetical protein